ncbi:MAG: 50S ribosomal protein L23 [Chloroflexi bacterium]|nr:50S ribosomal protein L23 [Chloroflexota bacterium]
MEILEVLRRPVITEKNTALQSQNQYTFEVSNWANKIQIKEAVEKAFNVKVLVVNVIHVPGKRRRVGRQQGMTCSWKKAVVTLHEGHKIELFEGV